MSKAWSEPAGAKWRVRGFVNGKRVTLRSGISTRAEAERFAQVVSAESSEAFADPAALTLASWGLLWLDRREADGVRGIRQERSTWARHVADSALAAMPLDAISAPNVVDWLDTVRRSRRAHATRYAHGVEVEETSEPVSPQTAKHALRLVRGALNDAVLRGILSASPAAAVKMPRTRRPLASDDGDSDGAWTFLSEQEIARVTALPEKRRPLFVVAIYTGLRLGELLDLRWADVDLERDRVRVRRSKNGKSRVVPLLPEARAALELAWSRRTTRQRTSPLVFCRPDGGAFATGYDGGWAVRWRERVTSRPVRFHDLRHTCASHLVLGTWGRALRLDEARAWLGHSSIVVTQRYAHLADGHLDELARTMAAATSQEPSQNGARGAFSRGKQHKSSGFLSCRSDVRVVPGAPSDSRDRVGKLWEAAQRVARAAEQGERPSREDEEALAFAVLSDPLILLAQQVLGGGPHASVRAVELAAWVLGGARLGAADEGSEVG